MEYSCTSGHREFAQDSHAHRIDHRLARGGIRIGVEPISRNRRGSRPRCDCRIVNRNGSPEKADHVGVSQELREIASVHFGGWNRKEYIFGLGKTISLVIEKEKGAVGSFIELGNPDRPANVKPEVVFAIEVAR